jgi:4-hydroxy-tetrahydrodipicolinate synthase
MIFKGSGVALITPFVNKEVNYEKFKGLIDFHLQNKTDALIICGTTGESSTLTDEEKNQLFEIAVEKAKGKIPVIAGTGSNNTERAIKLSKSAQYIGVDALLLVTPFYNKCTQNGLIEHFKEIAKNINLPIIVYNVPSRTGLNIEANTTIELSKIPNIFGIKEASGNMTQCLDITSQKDRDFSVYSGNDDQILPILSIGGDGVISVLANILPKETHEMCYSYFNGDIKTAMMLQNRYAKLIKLLFKETNPIPIKRAMNLLGFDVGDLRLPLTIMEENNSKLLEDELIKLKLLPKNRS